MVSKYCLLSLTHRNFTNSRMWKLSYIVKHSSHIYCLWHIYFVFSQLMFLHRASKTLFYRHEIKILGTHALRKLLWRQFVLDLFFCPLRDKQGRVCPRVCPSPHPFHPAPEGQPLCITFSLSLALWFPVGLPGQQLQQKSRGKRGVRSEYFPPSSLQAGLPGANCHPSHRLPTLFPSNFHNVSPSSVLWIWCTNRLAATKP